MDERARAQNAELVGMREPDGAAADAGPGRSAPDWDGLADALHEIIVGPARLRAAAPARPLLRAQARRRGPRGPGPRS